MAKETRYYPIIALTVAVLGSTLLVAVVAAVGTWLGVSFGLSHHP